MLYGNVMTNISIYPIFNQSETDVQDTFVEIRAQALAKKGIFFNESDIDKCRAILQCYWLNKPDNFAFGAYIDKQMVGQINGHCTTTAAFVDNLYVLPKFQKHGIGRRLLSATEKSLSVLRDNIILFSSYDARNFYKKRGYLLVKGDDFYKKNIESMGICEAVPLFSCTSEIVQKCSEFSSGEYCLLAHQVNELHTPVFVYRDINNILSGYCIIDTSSTSIKQKVYGKSNWIKYYLKNATDKYIQQYKLLQTHIR